MSLPLWMLLGFCGWTFTILGVGVGVWRWTLILGGRAAITDFPADTPHGSDGYQRVVRAHANCLETLPVFAAVVLIAETIDAHDTLLDVLACTVMAARVVQSSVHMLFVVRSRTVALRFSFFLIQFVAIAWMGVLIAGHALSRARCPMTGAAERACHRSGQLAENLRSRVPPSVRVQVYRDTLLAAAKRTARAVDTVGARAIWQRGARWRPPGC